MTELFRHVRRLLRTDGGRLVLVGSAFVALGLVALLASLLGAREAFADRSLGGLERVVLVLVFSSPAGGVPFVVGVLLLTLARRRGAPLHPQAVPALWGAAIAVAVLALAMAAAGLAAAVMGSFGAEADRFDLSAFRRLRVLVESGVGGLALAIAATAAGRALAADGDEGVTAPHPDATAGAVPATAGVSAPPPAGPAAGTIVAPHTGNGTAPAPALDPGLARWGAPLPAEPGPPPPSALDRRRSAYADALRFSPRADDARILLDRLERNPDDADAGAAFDALVGRDGR